VLDADVEVDRRLLLAHRGALLLDEPCTGPDASLRRTLTELVAGLAGYLGFVPAGQRGGKVTGMHPEVTAVDPPWFGPGGAAIDAPQPAAVPPPGTANSGQAAR
jgi:hypothetical protein